MIDVDILNASIQENVCPELQVIEGVFLGKAILKVNVNNKAFTTILNTNDYINKINSIQVTLEHFIESPPNIFSVENNNHLPSTIA